MVRTRSMTAVLRNLNLIKTKAAPPKRKAAQPQSKRKAAATSSEELERMAAAARAVDVDKILRLKKEAIEAMETKCFPLTARANQAAAAAGQTQQSGAEDEKVPEEKKKKVVTYLVSQGYIDHMKTAGLFDCIDEIPEDELAKRSQLVREGYHASVLLSEKLRAWQQVLLDQYDAFGYAYDAKEVTDDEAEDEAVLKNRPQAKRYNGVCFCIDDSVELRHFNSEQRYFSDA